jgi:hypothetical protein
VAGEREREELNLILCDRVLGLRTCMLSVGDGLNLQVAKERGRRRPDDWGKLLREIWRESGVQPPAGPTGLGSPLTWHRLVDARWRKQGGSWAQAEAASRKALVEGLRGLEHSCPKTRSLYTDILGAGFAHVLSFNVDRRLLLASRTPLVEDRAGRDFLTQRVSLESKGAGGTNVWFPYGSTFAEKTLHLGYAEFDRRLMGFESRRAGAMEDWFYGRDYMRPLKDVFEERWPDVESWYDLFFLAPLVFVGTSLSPSDWPLWWLLHQRERNVTPVPARRRPPTFYLTAEEADVSHLEGRPAGIRVVRFPTFDAMWEYLRSTLARTGGTRPPVWRR